MIKNPDRDHGGLGGLVLGLLLASAWTGGAVAQPVTAGRAAPPPAMAPASAAVAVASGDGPTVAADVGFDLASLRTPGALTADVAAARARASAPSRRRSIASARAAEASADRAWLGLLPRLDLSARYTRLSDVPQGGIGNGASGFDMADGLVAGVSDPQSQVLFGMFLQAFRGITDYEFPILLNQYAFRASVTYPVSDVFLTILPSYRAGRAFAQAERTRADAEAATVELRAREAFYGYARALGVLAVARSTVAQTESQRRQVESLVNAGVAARVDLMRVQALQASARVAEAQTRGVVAVAAHALRTLMHDHGRGDLPIGEDLSVPLPPLEGDRADFITRALDQRPEMRALRTLVRARMQASSVRAAARLPHLALSANVDVANPNLRVFPQENRFNGTWDVSAILSWSPNDLLTGNADLDAAEADVAQARADVDALSDAVRIEVTQAWEGNHSAQSALDAASAGIEAAEESYRVRQEQLDAGTAVTNDLIDAETELSRARLQLLNALIDQRVARARLRRALGG